MEKVSSLSSSKHFWRTPEGPTFHSS